MNEVNHKRSEDNMANQAQNTQLSGPTKSTPNTSTSSPSQTGAKRPHSLESLRLLSEKNTENLNQDRTTYIFDLFKSNMWVALPIAAYVALFMVYPS